MITCSRRLEFDAAHRVMRHESKCKNLHGHRYVIEVSCVAESLDSIGRVIDFSVLKSVVGGWIDTHLDHGTLLNQEDTEIAEFLISRGHKVYILPSGNPTAEVMAEHMAAVFNGLLKPFSIAVSHLRLYETPNCYADWRADVLR